MPMKKPMVNLNDSGRSMKKAKGKQSGMKKSKKKY